jgi:hypothetical protein
LSERAPLNPDAARVASISHHRALRRYAFFAFQKLIIIQFISKADQDLLYFETISMFVASILCEPKIRKTKR